MYKRDTNKAQREYDAIQIKEGKARIDSRTGELIRNLSNSVPEEHVLLPAKNILQPLLEGLALNEDKILHTMFYNLLVCAINREKQNLVHPAFAHILKLLAPDEAFMLTLLKEKACTTIRTLEWIEETQRFINPKIIRNELPTQKFLYPDHLWI